MRRDLHLLRDPGQAVDDTLVALLGWFETEPLATEWIGLIDQLEASYEDARREA